MTWAVPRMWDGDDVWIIGGGPSLTKQFGIPDKVVRSVVSGTSPPSVYSPYMGYLYDKHVIGVNVAFLIGDWVDMAFFGDNKFFLKYARELANFIGLRVSCTPSTSEHKWVKTLQRQGGKPWGISTDRHYVCWNGNSGAAAISVAVHAGAKRILLLGFDMKRLGDGRQHWHDLYGKVGNPTKPQKLPFDKHLMGFPYIAKEAKKRGVEIINLCPDSAIEQFRKMSISQFARENEIEVQDECYQVDGRVG